MHGCSGGVMQGGGLRFAIRCLFVGLPGGAFYLPIIIDVVV